MQQIGQATHPPTHLKGPLLLHPPAAVDHAELGAQHAQRAACRARRVEHVAAGCRRAALVQASAAAAAAAAAAERRGSGCCGGATARPLFLMLRQPRQLRQTHQGGALAQRRRPVASRRACRYPDHRRRCRLAAHLAQAVLRPSWIQRQECQAAGGRKGIVRGAGSVHTLTSEIRQGGGLLVGWERAARQARRGRHPPNRAGSLLDGRAGAAATHPTIAPSPEAQRRQHCHHIFSRAGEIDGQGAWGVGSACRGCWVLRKCALNQCRGGASLQKLGGGGGERRQAAASVDAVGRRARINHSHCRGNHVDCNAPGAAAAAPRGPGRPARPAPRPAGALEPGEGMPKASSRQECARRFVQPAQQHGLPPLPPVLAPPGLGGNAAAAADRLRRALQELPIVHPSSSL